MDSTQSKKVSLGVIFAVVIVLSFFAGVRIGSVSHSTESDVTAVVNKDGAKPPLVDFAPFWKAWNIIDDKFAGTSTDDQKRVYGAIQGMVASLGDPYTVFFPPADSKSFQSEIAGNFEGVGMEVGVKDGKLAVVAPIKGSPADKAGVKAGDYILQIDGKDSATMPTDQAVDLIRGAAGTKVKLVLGRSGVKDPITVSITRAQIDLPTVDTAEKPGGVFVISLYSFSENSANLFRQALRKFVDSGDHRLIIDLRGNPGGYLDAAVDMASWFLPSGKVVVREQFGKAAAAGENGGQSETVYRSKGYDIFTDRLRMVVLVDGGSASAAEILSGALSENGVATLVGEKTFGKGSVQELVDLTPDTSLKVTIAKWLTPDGNWISGHGITPKYVVPMTEDDVKAGKDPQMDKALQLLAAQP